MKKALLVIVIAGVLITGIRSFFADVEEALPSRHVETRASKDLRPVQKKTPPVESLNREEENVPESRDSLMRKENAKMASGAPEAAEDKPSTQVIIDKSSDAVRKRNMPQLTSAPARNPRKEVGAKSKSNPLQGAAGTAFIQEITPSGRVLVVSETGEGETLLLQEAFRLVKTGDKILLKKGHYAPLMNHLQLPSFELAGEGAETIVEIDDTLRVHRFDLSLKDLKLLHTGAGAAIEGKNGRKLLIENVELQGNGNDAIRVHGGNLRITNLKLQKVRRGIDIKNTASFSATKLQIVDSAYGIYSENNNNFAIDQFKTDRIDLFSVFFAGRATGHLECSQCVLGENSSNRVERLKLRR